MIAIRINQNDDGAEQDNSLTVDSTLHAVDDLECGMLAVSGAFECDGDLSCGGTNVSGDAKIRGDLECGTLDVSGELECNGDLTCADLSVSGHTSIDGDTACASFDMSGEFDNAGDLSCTNAKFTGGASIDGDITCDSLYVSGNLGCHGDLSCRDLKVPKNGNTSFSDGAACRSLDVDGHFDTDGDLTCETSVKISGKAYVTGDTVCKSLDVGGIFSTADDIECSTMSVSGTLEADGDVECKECAHITGGAVIKGRLTAKTVEIELCGENKKTEISSIKGERITILPRAGASETPETAEIVKSIVGDVVTIDCVKAGRAVGRILKIGSECRIETAEYTESIEISPSAQVGCVKGS